MIAFRPFGKTRLDSIRTHFVTIPGQHLIYTDFLLAIYTPSTAVATVFTEHWDRLDSLSLVRGGRDGRRDVLLAVVLDDHSVLRQLLLHQDHLKPVATAAAAAGPQKRDQEHVCLYRLLRVFPPYIEKDGVLNYVCKRDSRWGWNTDVGRAHGNEDEHMYCWHFEPTPQTRKRRYIHGRGPRVPPSLTRFETVQEASTTPGAVLPSYVCHFCFTVCMG